jgi:glycine/D-amino acid oxidase-like deaminating enzyme
MARGPGGRQGVIDLQRHLIAAVSDVIEVCGAEGIDADVTLGGTLAVACTEAQMSRLRSAAAEDMDWGLSAEDQWEMGPADTTQRVQVQGAVGSVFSPHCARIHPAKLVRGLADAVTKRGAVIYEHSPALAVDPYRVITGGGAVRARWVVRATEGYTAGLPGVHRRLLPMNSSMIVTEPLGPGEWSDVGWAGAETVRDGAHAYVYLQRTADGRIAIGGRGVPYRFGSRLERTGDTAPTTVAALRAALARMFPGLGNVGVARSWSGVLGVARDWCPSVGIERSGPGGVAWAGGYVGDGVATSHLAGMTVADLILGHDTSRTALPWVGHVARKWEPEPLRWLGVQGIYALYRAADRAESRHPDRPRTSGWAVFADRVSGRP